MRVIFPSYTTMCGPYPILKKVPILLPGAWVLRWIKKLFCAPGRIKYQKQKIALLKTDALDSIEAQMHAVGLGFHFEENEQ